MTDPCAAAAETPHRRCLRGAAVLSLSLAFVCFSTAAAGWARPPPSLLNADVAPVAIPRSALPPPPLRFPRADDLRDPTHGGVGGGHTPPSSLDYNGIHTQARQWAGLRYRPRPDHAPRLSHGLGGSSTVWGVLGGLGSAVLLLLAAGVLRLSTFRRQPPSLACAAVGGTPDAPGCHVLPLRVYYEDTDFSGAVYHANFLKFFERAREDILGPEEVARLWREEDAGWVVHSVEVGYREPARHADALEVRTTVHVPSPFRLVFHQSVWRRGGQAPLAKGEVVVCAATRSGKLRRVPDTALAAAARFPAAPATEARRSPPPPPSADAAHHRYPVDIYYEDTVFSGVVYHSNFLKYFERARAPLLGKGELARMWHEDGVGWAVARATLRYREGVRYGDVVEVRTWFRKCTRARVVVHQQMWREGCPKPVVEGELELCCIDRAQRFMKIPLEVMPKIQRLLGIYPYPTPSSASDAAPDSTTAPPNPLP